MELNTEDMSKAIFMTVIILAAIILSLSVFAHSHASDDAIKSANNDDSKDTGHGTIHCYCAHRVHDDSNNNGGSNHKTHKRHTHIDNSVPPPSSPVQEFALPPPPQHADENPLTATLPMVNITVHRDTDTYDILGQVYNNSSSTADVVTVVASFFDKQGNFLGENSDGADGIPPGQSKPFKIEGMSAVIENRPVSLIDHFTLTATQMG
jgi:hypothetical protein